MDSFLASLAHFQSTYLVLNATLALLNPYSVQPNHSDDELDLELVALCATYTAFERYVLKSDLFILPRSERQLENILRRYSYDDIHNAISLSRSALKTGGYSKVCHLAEKAIRDVLETGDNVQFLLTLHSSSQVDQHGLNSRPQPRSLETACK